MNLISIILKIHCHSQSLTHSFTLSVRANCLFAPCLYTSLHIILGTWPFTVAFRVYLGLTECMYVGFIKSEHSTHWIDSILHWIHKRTHTQWINIRDDLLLCFFLLHLSRSFTHSRALPIHIMFKLCDAIKKAYEYVKCSNNSISSSSSILFWKLFDKIAVLIKNVEHHLHLFIVSISNICCSIQIKCQNSRQTFVCCTHTVQNFAHWGVKMVV